jgi:hypothetical protein
MDMDMSMNMSPSDWSMSTTFNLRSYTQQSFNLHGVRVPHMGSLLEPVST